MSAEETTVNSLELEKKNLASSQRFKGYKTKQNKNKMKKKINCIKPGKCSRGILNQSKTKNEWVGTWERKTSKRRQDELGRPSFDGQYSKRSREDGRKEILINHQTSTTGNFPGQKDSELLIGRLTKCPRAHDTKGPSPGWSRVTTLAHPPLCPPSQAPWPLWVFKIVFQHTQKCNSKKII